jgi:hypothetical protein
MATYVARTWHELGIVAIGIELHGADVAWHQARRHRSWYQARRQLLRRRALDSGPHTVVFFVHVAQRHEQ